MSKTGVSSFEIYNRVFRELNHRFPGVNQSAYWQGSSAVPNEVRERALESYKAAYIEAYAQRASPQQIAQIRDAASMERLFEVTHAIRPRGRPSEFEVLEQFIGKAPSKVVIYSGEGGGDCGFGFRVGRSYLVEAHRAPSGEWHSWLCSSRTNHLEFAAADVEFLRSWKRGAKPPLRVYGNLFDSSSYFQGRDRRSEMSGVRIALTGGPSRIETTTEPDGAFEFSGLEPLQYGLQVEKPGWEVFRTEPRSIRIDLRKGSCAEASLWMKQEQGSITGRVLLNSDDEKLPRGFGLVAIEIHGASPRPSYAGCQRTGEFTFRNMEPGEYVVGINLTRSPTGPHRGGDHGYGVRPYAPTYYPGTEDRARATVVRVERGGAVQLDDWRLPPQLFERYVAGKIVMPGGRAAVNARIIMKGAAHGDEAGRAGPTGADGSFELWPIDGADYLVEAAAYDESSDTVFRAELALSDDVSGPLLIELAPSLRKPDDIEFFRSDWDRR